MSLCYAAVCLPFSIIFDESKIEEEHFEVCVDQEDSSQDLFYMSRHEFDCFVSAALEMQAILLEREAK
jgi:hypothetical protein